MQRGASPLRAAVLQKGRGVVSACSSHLSDLDTTLRLCAKSEKSAESAPKASDDLDEEQIFRDLWEDETQREVVIESLKADCEVRRGRAPGL